MEPLTLRVHVILAAAGFLAGFVDSVAGGGGIITVPALLSVGLPPHVALGTNKLQSSFGSFTAAVHYSHRGLAAVRESLPGMLFTAIGAAIGTVTIQLISPELLRHVIPVLLVGIFLYMLLSPNVGAENRSPRVPRFPFYVAVGLAIGFYDGFLGPGTGSFWMIALVVLLGLDLRRATANTKLMNFTSNIVALVFFALGRHVMVSAGVVMGVGEVLGAFLGSRMVIKKGVGFVRVFFLVVVALTMIRLIHVTYFS